MACTRPAAARSSPSTSARPRPKRSGPASCVGWSSGAWSGCSSPSSDAHAGLKAAIAKVLGCAWQRCTVHFLRDCFGHARKDQHGLLGALIRPIFNADSLKQARDRLSEAVAHLDGRLAKIATMLEDAEADILAFYAFPPSHWRKLRS